MTGGRQNKQKRVIHTDIQTLHHYIYIIIMMALEIAPRARPNFSNMEIGAGSPSCQITNGTPHIGFSLSSLSSFLQVHHRLHRHCHRHCHHQVTTIFMMAKYSNSKKATGTFFYIYGQFLSIQMKLNKVLKG